MAISVMTLNLKSETLSISGRRAFSKRAASIEELVRWHNPDLLGVQELTEDMLPQLDKITQRYTLYGRARNSSISNERNCVCFRKNRFTLLDGCTFWLSDSPEEPGSRCPASVFPRICTIAVLEDKETGAVFTFANTHLDHLLPSVRARQAAVLERELYRRKKGSCLILTGDFNTSADSPALSALLKSKRLSLKDAVSRDASSTLHEFISSASHFYHPVDHILISSDLTIEKSEIITSLSMGTYPSDHCPVMVTIHS